MHRSKVNGEDTHDKISMRLKKAKGHLEMVIRMLDDDKACVDVARQMHAVSKAVDEAKRIFIQEHIEHCLDASSLKDSDMTIKDFREITKYL